MKDNNLELAQRKSNVELLRLICMLMILFHHFAVRSFFPNILHVNYASPEEGILLFIHCFVFVGVNCFVLISGFFGIKWHWRSFINLYVLYATYGFIFSIGKVTVGLNAMDPLSEKVLFTLTHTFLPFSHDNCWFLNCYFILYLISPILNAATSQFDKKQFILVIIGLTIYNVYFGYFQNISMLNKHGHSVSQLAYMYMVGAYIRKYVDFYKCRKLGAYLYVIAATIWGALSFLNANAMYPEHGLWGVEIPFWRCFTYYNPLVIISSIGFFLLAMSFDFHDKTVNWMASSAVAAYVIQEIGIVNYDKIAETFIGMSEMMRLGLSIGLSVGFMLVALMLDKVRLLITNPILRFTLPKVYGIK